jgi:hypothetical protein
MDGLAAGLTSQPPCHFIKKARTMTDTRSSSPTAYDGFHLQSIAGQWRQGSSGKPKADRNPYSGETLVKIVQADRNDLDAAYRADKASARRGRDLHHRALDGAPSERKPCEAGHARFVPRRAFTEGKPRSRDAEQGARDGRSALSRVRANAALASA